MSLKDEVVCIMCQKEHACMQCLDCGPNAVYCRMCCFKKHDIDRHIIIHLSGGMVQVYSNFCKQKSVSSDHSCPSTYEEKITIIALKRKY